MFALIYFQDQRKILCCCFQYDYKVMQNDIQTHIWEKRGKVRGKTPTNFVKPNWIMQLAGSVSVAKIKIIYASTQRAHSEPSYTHMTQLCI